MTLLALFITASKLLILLFVKLDRYQFWTLFSYYVFYILSLLQHTNWTCFERLPNPVIFQTYPFLEVLSHSRHIDPVNIYKHNKIEKPHNQVKAKINFASKSFSLIFNKRIVYSVHMVTAGDKLDV